MQVERGGAGCAGDGAGGRDEDGRGLVLTDAASAAFVGAVSVSWWEAGAVAGEGSASLLIGSGHDETSWQPFLIVAPAIRRHLPRPRGWFVAGNRFLMPVYSHTALSGVVAVARSPEFVAGNKSGRAAHLLRPRTLIGPCERSDRPAGCGFSQMPANLLKCGGSSFGARIRAAYCSPARCAIGTSLSPSQHDAGWDAGCFRQCGGDMTRGSDWSPGGWSAGLCGRYVAFNRRVVFKRLLGCVAKQRAIHRRRAVIGHIRGIELIEE